MKKIPVFLVFCFCFVFTKNFAQNKNNKNAFYLDLSTNIGSFVMNGNDFHIAKVIDKCNNNRIGTARWTAQGKKDIFFKTNAEDEILAYFKKILPQKIPNNIPLTFELWEINIFHPFFIFDGYKENMPSVFIKGAFLDKNGKKLCQTKAKFQVKDTNQNTDNGNMYFYYGYMFPYTNTNRITTEIHYIQGIQQALKLNLLKFEKIWKKKGGVF